MDGIVRNRGRTKLDAQGKPTRRRKKKDPMAPKRPTTAYFYYLAKMREQFKQEGKHVSNVGAFTKEVSKQWRELSASEKKPFEALSDDDRKRYDREMNMYRKPKDPNQPKRPQSGYFLFLGDFRTKMKGKDLGHKAIIQEAGKAWNAMDAEAKRPYEEEAQKKRDEYEKTMTAYRKSKMANRQGEANGGAAASPPEDAEDDFEEDDDDDDDEDDE
ncbi:high mobility group-T protein [Lingula anatina]|uniref:High mobility group-T protein n=1 Tax=Lingula anatina TaxID=7574 RepID=A0A1S3K0B4_LINAN|nr:high mobility group-T protein [Lingula anatina]|eukprot:XP_013415987.1 high mobility group-T protein [Lingula anatina]